MKNKICDLIESNIRQEYATAAGRKLHKQLQKIFFGSNDVYDNELANKIKSVPDLIEIMGPLSRTEVPIAGFIDGHFISRRIDRLYVNEKAKKIVVLDYKSDINKNLFLKKYKEQLTEYHELLKQIYKDFKIECKILWTNDFTLENII